MRPDDVAAAVALAARADYWQSLCPHLPIDGWDQAVSVPADLAERMASVGYVQVSDLVPAEVRDVLIQAEQTIEAAGWLPTFVFLFDAPWRLARSKPLRGMVSALLNSGYRQLPDFWAYHVKPGERGYRPHREVSRDELVAADGSPQAITVWVALTDATLDNGCMYVVPRDVEQQPLDAEEYGAPPMALIPYLLHRARALPVSAGSALAWNHLILHWGAFSSPQATASRRSLSFEFIRSDIDPAIHPHSLLPKDLPPQLPLTLSMNGPLPSFTARLFFVARNVRSYYGRGPQDPIQQVATALLHQTWEEAVADSRHDP